MKYLTLDTCVWLGLIKIDLHNDNNIFEEICFWIENKNIVHITPENVIREWDRNKTKKAIQIINEVKTLNKTVINSFRGSTDLISAYQPDIVEEIITKRIDRVDTILKIHSEIAKESQVIYNEAIKRNLDCLAPNHSEDSFRDTINILSLIHYIKNKGYSECVFSTINYTDFSAEKQKKHDLHPHLLDEFKNSNLDYVFCDEDPFANKLLNVFLRPALPSFQDFLKKKKNDAEEKALQEKKSANISSIESADKDYLENIKYIDTILAKGQRTIVDEEIIKLIIDRHESYKQYFLRNVGSNGMV